MDRESNNMPWVVFCLLDNQFAVSAKHVREMVAMPKVAPVPEAPSHIRGVINLRHQVIPTIDLRLRMGVPSLRQESEDMIDLLALREQDHRNWIKELESSVRERREFKLATDPHRCAFGKWYDSFTTTHRQLSGCLARFDQPHRRVHGIAVQVKEMEARGEFDSALELIDRTRTGELAEMLTLFAELREILRESDREIALVLTWQEKTMAVAVDSVTTVERLAGTDTEDVPAIAVSSGNDCVAGIGRRGENNGLVQLIDVGALIGSETGVEAPEQSCAA